MSQIRTFLTMLGRPLVADLDAVTAFFVGLGLEVEGRMFMEGEFVDTVIGLGSRSQIVTLRLPEGGPGLELSRADPEPGSPTAMANELGLRNVSKSTTCRRRWTGWLRTATAWSAASVSTEDIWRMAYVRGPGDHRVPGRADWRTPLLAIAAPLETSFRLPC